MATDEQPNWQYIANNFGERGTEGSAEYSLCIYLVEAYRGASQLAASLEPLMIAERKSGQIPQGSGSFRFLHATASRAAGDALYALAIANNLYPPAEDDQRAIEVSRNLKLYLIHRGSSAN